VLGLVVDDLDALCDRIQASGRRVAPGIDLPGSWPVRFARDADGNMLELIGRPEAAPRTHLDRLQVGLTVADAGRMRAFYGGALGLPEQPSRPMGDGMTRYAFAVGDSTLKLWSRPEPLPRLSGAPGLRRGIRGVSLAVASLEPARAELASRGVAPAADPGVPGAERAFWIEDPEGGWIEIREECATARG
jgi:catechol 2,3-dioxygenase-like lactoylglutathione lyase family enzyme